MSTVWPSRPFLLAFLPLLAVPGLSPGVALAAPDRGARGEVALERGSLVRLAREHRGLPVVGGSATLRLDDRGVIRWSHDRGRAIPDDLEVAPTLSPAEAAARVGRGGTAELVVLAHPARPPRLVYRVVTVDRPAMRIDRAYVDAHTGAVFWRENLIRRAHPEAFAFEFNPVHTPDLSLVELSGLELGADVLESDDLRTLGCVDRGTCTSDFGFSYHACELEPTAIAHEGHFTHYTFESHLLAEDPFAEVQAFYHATKAYEVARALGGFTALDSGQLQVIVNYRESDYDESQCDGSVYIGSKELMAFDNAFFIPGDYGFLPVEGDAIVFGQGTAADFAYDGDVVYHEFGHAVMFSVAPDLSFGFIDEWGLNSTPGGLHEGYADLLTVFVSDEPTIGEYAGAGLGFGQDDFLRTAENDLRCPDDLVGESHFDGEIILGAMWEARLAVAGDDPEVRFRFDQAVFAAQQAFDYGSTFETAAELTVEELRVVLGDEEAEIARQVFEARGVLDCSERVVDGSLHKEHLWVAGSFFGDELLPGPVQFRYELSEPAQRIRVDVESAEGFFGGGFTSNLLLLLRAGEPIEWVETVAGHQAAFDREVRIPTSGGAASAVIEGPHEPGTYYLQFANRSLDIYLGGIEFSHDPVGDDGGEEPIMESSGGCGCHTGGGLAGELTLLLTPLALLVLRRRRRA